MENTTYKVLLKKVVRSPYVGIVILTLCFHFLFSTWSSLSTKLYSDGIFQIVRVVYDHVMGWSPIPFIYIALLIVFFYISQWIYRIYSISGIKAKLTLVITGLLKFVIVMLALFYFLWGFNYQSQTLPERLSFDSASLDRSYFENELKNVERLLIQTRQKVNAGQDVLREDIPNDLEDQLRIAQEEILKEWGIPTYGKVRVRKLHPKGALLRLSTAGIYIPHAIEGHIDGGLHPVQWPSTLAHEMAHGYSITDEGTCNFIALVTCLNTDVPIVQYSGLLMYYRYLVNNYQKGFLPSGEGVGIPDVIRKDIRAIRKYINQYPDLFPQARDIVYDQYLKSHGIKDGLDNYSTIIQMTADWKMSTYNSEIQKRFF